MICADCGARYPVADSGQIDLRLRRPVPVKLEVELGRQPIDSLDGATLEPNPRPEIDLEGFVLPSNVSRASLLTSPEDGLGTGSSTWVAAAALTESCLSG